MYAKGQGVPKDVAKAAHWVQKAGEQGDAVAQYALGQMYAEGKGVPKDIGKARLWLKKATDQGDARAAKYLEQLPK